jgi:proteasome lid subunit RPN8/RPN11
VVAHNRLNQVFISEEVITQITSFIANRSPESGGLLMGPPDKDAITFFQYDEWGSTSGSTYEPDAEKLSELANNISSEKGWIIKGVVHSHPGSMSSLSWGDKQTIQKYFKANSRMPYFIAPIVYKTHGSVVSPHSFNLKGNHCNSMIVHVIDNYEHHDQGALDRIVEVLPFTNLELVPYSSFTSTINMQPNLNARDKNDLEEMRKKAPRANSSSFEDGIVWYESFNNKNQQYQLAYWFDNKENQYKAAIVEGLKSHISLFSKITEDGSIDIIKNYKNPCSKAITARQRANEVIAKVLGITSTKSKGLPVMKNIYTVFKEIALILILGGILFVLWNKLGFSTQTNNQLSLSENKGIDQYFDNMNKLFLKDDSLTAKRNNTLLVAQGWTTITLEQINYLNQNATLKKEILLFLYNFQLIGFSKNNSSCQAQPTINLSKANLQNAVLTQQSLLCINLSGSDLKKVNFSQANLLNANLNFANLSEANLMGANLKGANLIGTQKLTNQQIKSACNWKDAIYKNNSDIINNKIFLENIENDVASDPENPIDCTNF